MTMRMTRSEGLLTHEGKDLPWTIEGPRDSLPCMLTVELPDGGLIEATTMLGMLDDTARQQAMGATAGEVEKLRQANGRLVADLELRNKTLTSKIHELEKEARDLVNELQAERAKTTPRSEIHDRVGAEAVMRAALQAPQNGAQPAPAPSPLANLPEDTIPEQATSAPPKRRGRPPKATQQAEPKILERTSFIAPQPEDLVLEKIKDDVDKSVEILARKDVSETSAPSPVARLQAEAARVASQPEQSEARQKKEPRDMSAGKLEGCADLTQALGWLATHDPLFWVNISTFRLDATYATRQFAELALHPIPGHFPDPFRRLVEKVKNLLVTPSAWSGKLGVCATNLRQGSEHKAMIVELVPEAEQITLQQVMAEWPSDAYPFEGAEASA